MFFFAVNTCFPTHLPQWFLIFQRPWCVGIPAVEIKRVPASFFLDLHYWIVTDASVFPKLSICFSSVVLAVCGSSVVFRSSWNSFLCVMCFFVRCVVFVDCTSWFKSLRSDDYPYARNSSPVFRDAGADQSCINTHLQMTNSSVFTHSAFLLSPWYWRRYGKHRDASICIPCHWFDGHIDEVIKPIHPDHALVVSHKQWYVS